MKKYQDFLYPTNWFYNKYYGHNPQRYWTFKVAMNVMLQRGGKNIVETGTTRVADWGGGCSTILFGEFAHLYDKTLYTVDIVPEFIDTAKELTKDYKDNIEYVVSDSVQFLKEFKKPIDLLYLDSMDYPTDGTDPVPSQKHNVREFMAAEKNLHKDSVVLLDDCDFPGGGKPLYTIERLEDSGWMCLINNSQSLWIKK